MWEILLYKYCYLFIFFIHSFILSSPQIFQIGNKVAIIVWKKGGGHSVAILSFYTEYSFNSPSICLFLAITGRSGDDQFTVTFRLIFQLSICMSVCLFPSPNGRKLYIYTDLLIILSIDNLYFCLSVPLAGRSRYIDISMTYILSKLKY